MSLKLDLSNMSHVHSDDKTTTLKHKHGHEIKLHHNVLSKSAQAQLKALADASKPKGDKQSDLHDADKKMAKPMYDGGQVAKPTGHPDAKPDAHPEQYDQSLSNGWNNIKSAFGHAEGGEIKKENYSPKKIALFCEYCGDKAHHGECKEDGMTKYAKGGNVKAEEAQPQEEQSNAPEADETFQGGMDHSQDMQQQDPNEPGVKQELAQASDQAELNAAKQTQASLAPNDQPQAAAAQEAQQPAPADPQQTPVQPPVAPQTAATMEQPPANPIQQYKNDVQNELHQEGLAYQADRTNGHIDAPSAEKMFHDKSTLGKLGTLFSLIVGGAGAGLSHQPNLAYQAMQNQLDRDFKAQTVSAENAQNYFRLNQQNLMNQANINQTNTEVNIKAAAAARIQMNWDALNKLTEENSKLPEGSPQRRQGDQVLALLNDQIQKGNYAIGAQAASAAATARALGMTSGGGSGGMGASASPQQISNMKLLGPMGQTRADELEHKTISGIPEVAGQMASRPINEGDRKEITAMKTLDDKGKDLFNYISKYKGMDIKRLDPKVRAVAEQKVEELKNFYNQSIQGGALTEGRLSWYDKQFGKGAPTDPLPQMLGQTDRLHEMVNSNKTRMNTNLKSMGFNPKGGDSTSQSQAAAPQEETRMAKAADGSMKPAIFNPKTKQFIRWGK